MTRDKTRAKEKARAEPLVHEGEDSEEDAYGSDDPEHQNPSQDPDHSAPLDAPDGEVDGAPQGSPKGHKRSRINSAGQGAPVQVKAEKIKSLFEPLVRDTDGCAVSSFPPSPPCSFPTQAISIACAIALGLNWPPSPPDGYIEIELKGKIGKQNLVVRRNLISTASPATGREVTQKMNELNVQVGNLCSFLPQDKVSEFAHMSPQQLLRETQRAAGDPRLTNWHDTLISAGKEMAQLVEREVQRFNERREFERQIALVELILPFMEYMEAKRYYTDTLQQKNQPIHNFKKQLDTRLKRLGEQRDGKKDATRKRFKAMRAKQDESEKLDTQAEEISNKLSNLKNAEKARAKKIQDTEANVRRLQADLEKPRDVESMEDLEEEGRRLAQSNTGTRQRQFELREQQQRFIDEESRAKAEITEGERALKQLDDVSHRKLQGLAKFDPDCAAVIHWLRKNTHRFRMEIIEPAAVSLTVPNKNYVNAVEACFNTAQLKTFVAQCNDDYKLLNQLVSDTTEALGKQVRITTWFRPGDANITPPPMTQDELREIGFDGYAIDFVDCPPPMRVFLMRECQLHRTAIALQPNRVDPARAMEAVSRTGGGSYILGNILNSVMRSHYGRRLPQNLTRDVRPARTLVGPVADPAARQNIERRIAQGRDQLAMCAEEGQRLGELDREIKGEQNAYKAASDKLRARKQAVADEKRRVNAAETRLRTQQDRLTEMRKEKSTDKERADLKKSLLKVTRQRTDVAQQYAGLVRLTIKDQTDATKLGLEHLQESSRKHALEVLLKECDGEYQTALTEFNAANTTYVREKERCKELLDVSKAKLDEVDDELRDTFKAMEESGKAHERTADQLKDELETLRQKLELVLAADPGVIDQYERRKEEIKTLTKKIEDRERAAAKVEKSMKVARDNWHPALQDLVTSIGKRFSEAFDRIGCAGELQLAPHDDYEKWAITILVKFRDTEQLQQLTAHRQSGGERSLTTILYLMSMTEYARAPFSLVDEINQGMDQRAERAVHNELVKTTCKMDSGQYFLITPKLLPDLKYDRLMKVLCVNNGEWLPEDNSLGNMMSMIRNYVTKRGSSGAASVYQWSYSHSAVDILGWWGY
ncbi:P-loop containing nucleoside triphosphate hydrolase protein [Lactarius deliciosus]|nr:P-loop containing nucleoside triphosphate hydrolase protein [Lactarius deliciosus]